MNPWKKDITLLYLHSQAFLNSPLKIEVGSTILGEMVDLQKVNQPKSPVSKNIKQSILVRLCLG